MARARSLRPSAANPAAARVCPRRLNLRGRTERHKVEGCDDPAQQGATTHVRVCQTRPQRDDHAEVGDGRVVLAEHRVGATAAEVSVRHAWVLAHHQRKVADGLVKLATVHIRVPLQDELGGLEHLGAARWQNCERELGTQSIVDEHTYSSAASCA